MHEFMVLLARDKIVVCDSLSVPGSRDVNLKYSVLALCTSCFCLQKIYSICAHVIVFGVQFNVKRFTLLFDLFQESRFFIEANLSFVVLNEENIKEIKTKQQNNNENKGQQTLFI
jgi:hypothetical protein